MGQEHSNYPTLVPIAANYDRDRSMGDWWFIGKTRTTPWDQDADELSQSLSWNPVTQKIEIIERGYKNNNIIEYTHAHKQLSSHCDTAPAVLKAHHNGYWKSMTNVVLWINYDQYLVWADSTDGTVYVMSRSRHISDRDLCGLDKILRSVNVPPTAMHWNRTSVVKDLPIMDVHDGEPTCMVSRGAIAHL
jgi:hypothetical protein